MSTTSLPGPGNTPWTSLSFVFQPLSFADGGPSCISSLTAHSLPFPIMASLWRSAHMLWWIKTTQTISVVLQEVTCLPYRPQTFMRITFRIIVTWCPIFNLSTIIIQKCRTDSCLMDTTLNNPLFLVRAWHINPKWMDACLWISGTNKNFQAAGGKQVLKCFSWFGQKETKERFILCFPPALLLLGVVGGCSFVFQMPRLPK